MGTRICCLYPYSAQAELLALLGLIAFTQGCHDAVCIYDIVYGTTMPTVVKSLVKPT